MPLPVMVTDPEPEVVEVRDADPVAEPLNDEEVEADPVTLGVNVAV